MKLSYLFAAILVLPACATTVSEAPVEEKPIVKKEARPSLPLPEFPNYLTSKSKLDASDSGDIYYPIKSPYDFTRVLNGYDELPTHTGKGTLVLPEGASADSPVPAMVILGLKKGAKQRMLSSLPKMASPDYLLITTSHVALHPTLSTK